MASDLDTKMSILNGKKNLNQVLTRLNKLVNGKRS